MITVVVTPGEYSDIARAFLPATRIVAKGAGCRYYFFQTDAATDFAFTDGAEVLVEVHAFRSFDVARAWVTENIRQRSLLLAAGGRAQ